MKMKSIKNQILFGLPILAALSALPRVAQAQEEIRFDGNISLKLVEEAQVACAKEAVAPIWKAVFGRDLGKGAKAEFYQSLQPGFSRASADISDSGNRVDFHIAAYNPNYAGSFLGLTFIRNNTGYPIANLKAKDFPLVAFEIPENSPYDSLGNPVSKEFILKNVRIVLNAPMTTRSALRNEETEKVAHAGVDTARYVSCLSTYFRQ